MAKSKKEQAAEDAIDLAAERNKLRQEVGQMDRELLDKARWTTGANILGQFEASQEKRRAAIKREFRRLDKIEDERSTRERLTRRAS